MYDLVCVLPLYGSDLKNCINMAASLAKQNFDNYEVFYKIYYDDTVNSSVIDTIDMMFKNCEVELYDFEYCENTHSGYKRNKGLEFALANEIPYIWFIDQDDYLIYEDTFKGIVEHFKEEPEDIIRVKFNIPYFVGEKNTAIIYNTVTMPWQYIFKTTELKNYRFNETIEYGSDIPVTVFYLIDKGYLEQNEYNKFAWKQGMPTTIGQVYFYNYLNVRSVMGTIKTDSSSEEYNIANDILQKKYKEVKRKNAEKVQKTIIFN